MSKIHTDCSKHVWITYHLWLPPFLSLELCSKFDFHISSWITLSKALSNLSVVITSTFILSLEFFDFFCSTLQRWRVHKMLGMEYRFLDAQFRYSFRCPRFWLNIKYYYNFFVMSIFWIQYLFTKSSANILCHVSKCFGMRIRRHWNV